MTNFGWWAQQLAPDHFLCQLCFEGKPVAEAWIDEHGDRWDTCLACTRLEEITEMRRDFPDDI